ncbi:MAG: type I methionyl aminopeptidase [Anaerohalosphaeraceae bacterium]|nr:type I methionyl aminopeptidase [Anaerohalosphaeraceae bacterium]
MAITLRSKREIELMRRAGAVVAEVLSKLREIAVPGMSTAELNTIAEKISAEYGAATLFKGVKSPFAKKPFPAAICASLNEQVVHGIPSEKTVLKEGDILSVDFGVKLNGYCGDSAVTIPIGQIDADKQKLVDTTKRVLDIAVEQMRPGVKWSSVAAQMQRCAESAGFSVVREFVGHGIGTQMHEDPKVQNFVNKDLLRNDIFLAEGMVIAVEPMINMGTAEVVTLKDGWTVATKDSRPSAHFEHTIAVSRSGNDVLTI